MKVMVLSLFIWLGLLIGLITGKVPKEEETCGYDACPEFDHEKLNFHFVPHSHDDVGWLKTVDQYYWGTKMNIQRAGVQYIIDSVISALKDNPERRFVQVESAFLHKWWLETTEDRRNDMRQLIRNGQLEIVGGAWSMNDEAAVHYQSVIDQFTLGFRFLNETFGQCARPKIGWQIDPFGHSREMANIFANMGFDGLFFARLDFRDHARRKSTSETEMMWKTSANFDHSELFTSIFYDHYSSPTGYCFDILCNDIPVIDDVNSPEYNQKNKVQGLAFNLGSSVRNYKTNHFLITMGDDFAYQEALANFANLDKLIEGFQKFPQTIDGKTIHALYSTPGCYVKAVNEEAKLRGITFPEKTGDFFPYASDPHAYWTGYFTSRPTHKRMERSGNNILQMAKQLSSSRNQLTLSEIEPLQQVMGIMQHHDAITGTEKQHVADDYARLFFIAIEKSLTQISKLISDSLSSQEDLQFTSCLLANVSICSSSQTNEFLLAVYNPIGHKVTHNIRLPVDLDGQYEIEGPNGFLQNQVLPSIDSFNHLSDMKPSKYELVFIAEDLPALGAHLYKVKLVSKSKKATQDIKKLKFGSSETGFTINELGYLQTITMNGRTINATQELMYYVGARGTNTGYNARASGAYAFRPSPDYPQAMRFNQTMTYSVFSGDLVDEVHQQFSDFAKQIIRVYKNSSYVEFDWLVGPIDVSDGKSREVISRFSTDINSHDVFYTDSNGREMLKRIRNHRDTYNFTDEEPISGNYYPVTSRILIKDATEDVHLSILNDRSQGGSSLASGEIELMLHRRLLDDDNFGLSENLYEEQFGQGSVARGQHYVVLGSSSNNYEVRNLIIEKHLSPWILLTNPANPDQVWNSIKHEFSDLKADLPKGIHLLTLEPWEEHNNKLLIRLEHILEKNEDAALSQELDVGLTNLFTDFDIVSLEEMTLDGLQPIGENSRLQWNSQKRKSPKTVKEDFVVSLQPMEIRTFVATVQYTNK